MSEPGAELSKLDICRRLNRIREQRAGQSLGFAASFCHAPAQLRLGQSLYARSSIFRRRVLPSTGDGPSHSGDRASVLRRTAGGLD